MPRRRTFALALSLALAPVAGACAVEPIDDDPDVIDRSMGDPGELDLPGPWDDLEPELPPPPAPVDAPFRIRAVNRKCVDVGGDAWQQPGAPVFIYTCNGTSAQRIHVVEHRDDTRDVALKSSTGLCLGVRGGVVAPGRPLELQTCTGAPSQRFALDGDAILVGTQASGRVDRAYVIELQRGRGRDRTPLEVGRREVDDPEYFVFEPLGARLYPTSGFVRVATFGTLNEALYNQRWGTVIDVAPHASIRLPDLHGRYLREGVTLRGSRRGMDDGPLIYRDIYSATSWMFQPSGPHVRITGLRFRGPSAGTSTDLVNVTGLGASELFPTIIDHNELSAFPLEAIVTWGPVEGQYGLCMGPPAEAPRVRIIANYIHDNAKQGAGYGVNHGPGSNSYIFGNTFAWNRHAIAAGSHGETHYTAHHNLVLAGAHRYGWGWWEHDFDVHGSEDPGHWVGGRAGGRIDIGHNTFLGERRNVHIRGTPCVGATIHHNRFVEESDRAIRSDATYSFTVKTPDNEYDVPNPMASPAQGDFDGDGVLDDFVGTGTGWYYRPGRTKAWRFLNRHPERTAQLHFGDFDGDGRTDVRIVRPAGFAEISWGGSSPWDL